MPEKESFQFTYSAKEQEEIKAIRQKYTPTEESEDKMERLRRLDNAVTQKATTVSLILGVMGTLILGMGMSLAMTEIGSAVGLTEQSAMLAGILIGLLGIVLVGLAYPLYNRIVTKERKKIAPVILKLTEELMQ